MQNPMQVAEKRIKEYRMAISKKENEIIELKERLEDLDNFLEFGQALVSKPGEAAQQPAPEKPKAEAETQPRPSAEDKADDDWGTDDEASPINNGITRVLSQRTG